MMPVQPSSLLTLGFILLSLSIVFGVGYALKSWTVTLALISWAALTAVLAVSGVLSDFSRLPPPSFILLATSIILAVSLAFSRIGASLAALPMSFLVGFLAFRIIVELLIHRAVVEGVAPPQMSWNGQNFDIFAGVSALLLAPLADRLPRGVILGWNTLAMMLLLWTVSVAVRSLPTPLQQFEPTGTWVTEFPFVWLPSILVSIAFVGHMVIYRKLLRRSHRAA